jgi:arabinogalactan endo-1,4-beta-galactosidase
MKKAYAILFFLILCFAACKKERAPKTDPVDPPNSFFARGADVSWITEMEAAGNKLYNSAGTETECMELMKDVGMNTIRLRVWVNPSPSWNNKADVVAKAIRAKNAGMKILINFHYGDSWADPGKQTKPAAWNALSLTALLDAMAHHTTEVLTELKNNGITPEWVQVGNETNDGMLWPEGKASVNMSNFVQMINKGYDAVKAVFPYAKVIVHVSNGWDNSLFRWLFDGLKANGGKYDIIGMSLYPSPANWTTLNTQCLVNMNDMVTRYNKDVMVVEIGMPWDHAAECKSFITDLITKIKAVSASRGLGVLYWEPQAYNNWKGYTLGAFDNTGKPTIAMQAFSN